MKLSLGRAVVTLLPSPPENGVLAAGERRTLERVAEVLLEGAPMRVDVRRVAANVEQFLVTGQSRRAWRVRVLLRLIEASTVPTHGRPFSWLTLADRRAVIRERWTTGRHVYRLCAKVRNLVVLGAYGDANAQPATGYVPVPLRPRFGSIVSAEAS